MESSSDANAHQVSHQVTINSLFELGVPLLNSLADAKFSEYTVTRDGSNETTQMYMLNGRALEPQEVEALKEMADLKIALYQKWIDFRNMNISKANQLIEWNREEVSKQTLQRDDCQSLLHQMKQLKEKLGKHQPFRNDSSRPRDTRAETQPVGIEVGANSVTNVPAGRFLRSRVRQNESKTPSVKSENGGGIKEDQTCVPTSGSDDSDADVFHSFEGNNGAGEPPLSVNRRMVRAELNIKTGENTTSTVTVDKDSINYQKMLAIYLVREKGEDLEDFKKKKIEAGNQKQQGRAPGQKMIKGFWVGVSNYLAKHDVIRNRKEVRREACALGATSVENLKKTFGLTVEEAELLHGLFNE